RWGEGICKIGVGDRGLYKNFCILVEQASEAKAVLKKDSLSLALGASAEKKTVFFRRVITAVVEGIESKKDFSARRQVVLQIAQKKVPFCRSPTFLCRMVKVKVRRERRDPIELLTEVRQRLENVDPINEPLHAKQLQQFGEQRNALDVEAHDGVAKGLQDEQEESASATEIENAFGPRAM